MYIGFHVHQFHGTADTVNHSSNISNSAKHRR